MPLLPVTWTISIPERLLSGLFFLYFVFALVPVSFSVKKIYIYIQVVLFLCNIWGPTGFTQTDFCANRTHFPHRKQCTYHKGDRGVGEEKTSFFNEKHIYLTFVNLLSDTHAALVAQLPPFLWKLRNYQQHFLIAKRSLGNAPTPSIVH